MEVKFEKQVEKHLEQFDGGYDVSIDIDYETGLGKVSIAYEDGSELPALSDQIEEMQEELEAEGNVTGDWNPENNHYTVIIGLSDL